VSDPVRAQPDGLGRLDLAAYLLGDNRMLTRCRIAFLAACREAAVLTDDLPLAQVATGLLRGGPSFDQAFRTHYYPALLSGGVDHYTGDDDLSAECARLLAALAEVRGPTGG
jgi:hypothetical protein